MIAAIDKDPTLQKRRVFLRQCDFAMDIEAKESRPDRDGVRIAALAEIDPTGKAPYAPTADGFLTHR